MKRKLLTHVDVVRVMARLRELAPARFFRRTLGRLGEATEVEMFIAVYDADTLLAALNDEVYKLEGEGE